MSNLFILNETFSNGLTYDLLNLISILSVFSGIFVIVSKNPIVSVLFLIGLFLTIAGYLMMVGINFIGLSYLLVYVGAVSILFLFILMLINVRVSELITDNNNSIPLAIMIGIIFTIILEKILPSDFIRYSHSYNLELDKTHVFNYLISSNQESVNSINPVQGNYLSHGINNFLHHENNNLSFVTSQIWDGWLTESSHITSIGNIIYTVYPIWLILTSIILLLAMVGAIVITIKQ